MTKRYTTHKSTRKQKMSDREDTKTVEEWEEGPLKYRIQVIQSPINKDPSFPFDLKETPTITVVVQEYTRAFGPFEAWWKPLSVVRIQMRQKSKLLLVETLFMDLSLSDDDRADLFMRMSRHFGTIDFSKYKRVMYLFDAEKPSGMISEYDLVCFLQMIMIAHMSTNGEDKDVYTLMPHKNLEDSGMYYGQMYSIVTLNEDGNGNRKLKRFLLDKVSEARIKSS